VAFQEGLYVLRRDETHLVPHLDQPTRNVMRACTGLHADQALRNIDKALHELSPGYASAHDDLAAPILADQMERVLADIDSDCGNVSVLLQVG
jgi:hypothetical protein